MYKLTIQKPYKIGLLQKENTIVRVLTNDMTTANVMYVTSEPVSPQWTGMSAVCQYAYGQTDYVNRLRVARASYFWKCLI